MLFLGEDSFPNHISSFASPTKSCQHWEIGTLGMTIQHVTPEVKIHRLLVFGPIEALHAKINVLPITIDFGKWWVWLSKAATTDEVH